MNSNFTCLRNIICVLTFSLIFTEAFSQNSQPMVEAVSNLKASVENDHIIINWNTTDQAGSNYCQVQASTDGKTFKTIGLVLGADPKQSNNSFIFKQDLRKRKSGRQLFYRILAIDNNDRAYASNVIKASN